MNIDESRRDNERTRVKFTSGLALHVPYLNNAISAHGNVAAKPRIASAVNNGPVTEEEVKLLLGLPDDECRLQEQDEPKNKGDASRTSEARALITREYHAALRHARRSGGVPRRRDKTSVAHARAPEDEASWRVNRKSWQRFLPLCS